MNGIDIDKIRKEFEKYNSSYWDFRFQEKKLKEIIGWNNEVRRNSSNLVRGFSARVLINNSWGFAASTNLDKINEIIKKAVRLAKLRKNDGKTEFDIPAGIKDKKETPQKIKFADIEEKDKVKFIKGLTKKGLDFDKRIKSVIARYSEIMDNRKFLSANSFIEQNTSRGTIRSSIGAKSASDEEEKFIGIGQTGGYEFTEQAEEKIIEACKRAIKFLEAKKGKPGSFPIIIDGILSGLLAHEALGHATEADNILQDSGCLVGKMGNKLSQGHVNICDDATENNFTGWGSYYYDDEGTKSQKTYLIKNGILNSWLHNLESASILKAKPTGNARAESVFVSPIIRMSNTYIETGDSNFEEMLKEVKEGYYMAGGRGGQVDPPTGNFQFSAEDVYLIKNKKMIPVKSMSFGGNLLEILQNISLIDKNYDSSFPGMCGKSGQHVTAGGTCPKITLKGAIVS